MTDRMYLGDPEQTARGGREIAAAGERLSDLLARHRRRIQAISGGKPWGGDDAGREFEKNYLPAEDDYFPAATQVGSTVTGVGELVQRAVAALRGTDEANAGDITKRV